MLIFGVDVPLVEIMLLLSVLIAIILLEVIIILLIQARHMHKIRQVREYLETVTGHLSEAKRKELEKGHQLHHKK